MICKDRNIIFVHIPKCGGSSVEDVLWSDVGSRSPDQLWMGFVRPMFNKYQTGGLQHLTAHYIKQEVGDQFFNSSFKFAVVRNPIHSIVSQFKYIGQRPDLRAFIKLPEKYTFQDYLLCLDNNRHVQWMPQWEFVADE